MAAEMYDREFSRYMALAKGMIAKLPNAADKKVCTKWVQKLLSLDSQEILVKKNRNAFFRYMISVMSDGVMEGPLLNDPSNMSQLPQFPSDRLEGGPNKGDEQQWLENEVFDKPKPPPNFVCHWSPDGKTYVAAKPIPGRGALVFMATSNDPCLGWDIPCKPRKS